MKQRKMGSLDWPVSALGFGAMRLPGRRFNRLVPDQAKSSAIIRSGIDQGINYVDTAYVYPGSERAVGEALKDGYRERVHLVTKLPVFLTRKSEDFDKYLATSLERLQTHYLDAYLLLEQLADVYRRRMAVPCTACRYCMPCPYGVNIPQNFAIWNNVSMNDKGWQSGRIKRSYRKLARTPAKVNLEKPNGSAAVCTKCRACVPKCPQEIDIPNELVKCEAALR